MDSFLARMKSFWYGNVFVLAWKWIPFGRELNSFRPGNGSILARELIDFGQEMDSFWYEMD